MLVFILSLLAFWPTFAWWQRRADSDDWVLASVAALVVAAISMVRQPRSRHPLPTWLLVVGCTVAGAAAWWMRVPTIRAAGAVIVIWMALLLWRGASWHQHLPALVLAMAALPTRASIDVWCGWPLRRFSAELAASLLGGTTSESLLAIEGKLVDVTEQCAGIASLHLLWLLLLALAVWQQRWWSRVLLAVIAATLVAVTGNSIRIVVLAAQAGHLDIAAIIHQPLGVLAFGAAIGVGHLIMDGPLLLPSTPVRTAMVPRWLGESALVMATVMLVMIPTAAPPDAPDLDLSSMLAGIDAHDIVLKPAEHALFGSGAVVLKGSREDGTQLLVVASRDPRHHHEPERCLSAGGQSPLSVMQVPIDDHLNAHWVHLEGGDTFTVYVAANRLITDPAARWADSLKAPSEIWIGITLLVPSSPAADTHHTAKRLLPRLVATAQQLLNATETP